MKKACYLVWLSLSGAVHRLRHDLGRELVVGFSGLILLGLFIYVFGDFLTIKTADLPPTLQSNLSQGFGIILLGLTTLICSRLLRQDRSSHQSFYNAASRLGESPGILRLYRCVWWGMQVVFFYALAWWVLRRFIHVNPSTFLVVSQIFFLLTLLGSLLITANSPSRVDTGSSAIPKPWQPPQHPTSPQRTLFLWRWYQMLQRNRLTRLTLGMGMVFSAVSGLNELRSGPFFLTVLAALITGLFAAMALAFQMEDDVRALWAERGMGISDDQYQTAYRHLGLTLGLIFGAVTAIFFSLNRIIGNMPIDPILVIQVFAAATLAPYIMPGLLFQIDPRRPAIQAMTCGLLTLFLGTAILAHWLAIALPPLLVYYTQNYQRGQFYRAS